MTKKLNEVAPQRKVFEAVDTRKTKEDILNKEIVILAYAQLTGKDGEFGVILAHQKDKREETFTTTVNKYILDRLKDYGQTIGFDDNLSTPLEKYFNEPCETKVVSQTSASQQKYYILE